MRRFRAIPAVLVLVFALTTGLAYGQATPSVGAVVDQVRDKLKEEYSQQELLDLTVDQVLAFLTPEEKRVLGTEHLTFRVNVPAIVSIGVDTRVVGEDFWLEANGFEPTDLKVTVDGGERAVWRKRVGAGPVGLGIHAFSDDGYHYFVMIAPAVPGTDLRVTDIEPAEHTLGVAALGAPTLAGRGDKVFTDLPEELDGQVLIRGSNRREQAAHLVDYFRRTEYPSSTAPDQILLTWSDDPRTTQTVQWRTSTEVDTGEVMYSKEWAWNPVPMEAGSRVVAETRALTTPSLVNDWSIHRHTAVIHHLEPDTTYRYAVGDGSPEGWSDVAEFTTAPATAESFSFLYMGDAQKGLDEWGALTEAAFTRHPDVRFLTLAGDLINRGGQRNEWDSFFHNGAGLFGRRAFVPTIGNHEMYQMYPGLYLDEFTLRENGPAGVTPERAYAFEYSNALFVVLDSNLPPETQAAWLEEQLASTSATWKFAVFHHPIYSSKSSRDNPELRKQWGALFDKHHVDLVLQGHDHAYLRTHPMRGEKPVASPNEGTVYVVSNAGSKYYDQDARDYSAVGFTKLSTYQVIDIDLAENRLTYRAVNADGKVIDQFTIDKD